VLKERVKDVWYWVGKWGCRVFCILFFRFRVYGTEHIPDKGPFILVSNHQSFLDPIFCGVAVKRRMWYVARDSLFRNWFLGWLISTIDTIPVERDKADLSAVKQIMRRLKEGMGICMFPEGTRSSDGRIAKLKGGFGLLCRRTEAAIVPMVIEGAFECWPKEKKIFSRGPIAVCYGKAIRAQDVKGMSDEKLAELVTNTLRRMQSEFRVKQGKRPLEY